MNQILSKGRNYFLESSPFLLTPFIAFLSSLKKENLTYKIVCLLFLLTLSLKSYSQIYPCDEPTNFTIVMEPNPSGFYSIYTLTSNPCLKTYRVCWKVGQTIIETPGPTNFVPPFPGSLQVNYADLDPAHPDHIYETIDTCNPGSPHKFDTIIAIASIKYTQTISKDCDFYTWPVNGTTYTTSGKYLHIGAGGESSTLDLTINYSSSNTTTASACNSYTWSVNGITYTNSGTYTVTTLNATCCVHTETLNLTITNSTSNTTYAAACDSYTWSMNGTTYTASGTYTHTSLNSAGCTHTSILLLTITALCSTCICPTVSQWGLMLIALLSIAVGMVFIYKKETALAYTGYTVSSSSSSGNPLLFNSYLFFKSLGILSILAFIGLGISYLYYSELTLTDAIGTTVCTVVVAYIVQLYWMMRDNEHERFDFE